MRIVFAGASEIALETARYLIKDGHEVIIIEKNKEKIEEISEGLDCSFLHGDVNRPDLLQEAGPKETDVLFCLTDDDPSNLIASLVGRSLGFSRVVTSIHNPDYESISKELGLEDVINPSRTISRYLKDAITGMDVLELSTMIKDEARFFSFICQKEEEGKISDLKLPEQSKVVCLYRDEKFILPEEDFKLKKDDEVVILTHSKNLKDLKEKWQPEDSESREEENKSKD